MELDASHIDHGEETHAETELPVDVSTFLSRGLQDRRRDMRQSGEVKSTGRTRKVLDYRCDEYVVQTWPVRGAAERDYSSRRRITGKSAGSNGSLSDTSSRFPTLPPESVARFFLATR
ncbi:MAG: hypothetical protein ABIF77_19220 [bacterium]